MENKNDNTGNFESEIIEVNKFLNAETEAQEMNSAKDSWVSPEILRRRANRFRDVTGENHFGDII